MVEEPYNPKAGLSAEFDGVVKLKKDNNPIDRVVPEYLIIGSDQAGLAFPPLNERLPPVIESLFSVSVTVLVCPLSDVVPLTLPADRASLNES
jgi:hypothetical protein